jgi:hypothetical protein
METTTKIVKYEWANKLSYFDRQQVVSYYLQGYGLYHIGISFGVSTSTIEYHLKKANVFIPRKKPTLFGNQNPIIRRVPKINRTLVARPIDDSKYYFDEYGDRYNRPKSYIQLLKQYKNYCRKHPIIKRNIPESYGFVLKVSLTSDVYLQRDKDGNIQARELCENNSYSNNLNSW